jgi:pyridoxamine 5'-phosphate oxidase
MKVFCFIALRLKIEKMSVGKDLSDNRRNYIKHELVEGSISANPYQQFAQWFEDAGKGEVLEPNAMTLATADKAGKPSARIVLLKAFNEQGFVFYTNYLSRKGAEIAENNQGALLFYWDVMERQIRIEGTIEKVEVALSEEYFASRPYESRLSAIVSEQSQQIPNRQFLEIKLEEIRKTGVAKRPENWGGYQLKAGYFEFWQGRANRLHDRIAYTLENGVWVIKRLAP